MRSEIWGRMNATIWRSYQTVLYARTEACFCLGAEVLKISKNERASPVTGTLQYLFYGYKAGELS